MGLFWDLYQQSQLSQHAERSGEIETRVAMLERVLVAMLERGARFVTAEQLATEFRAANAKPASAL